MDYSIKHSVRTFKIIGPAQFALNLKMVLFGLLISAILWLAIFLALCAILSISPELKLAQAFQRLHGQTVLTSIPTIYTIGLILKRSISKRRKSGKMTLQLNSLNFKAL